MISNINIRIKKDIKQLYLLSFILLLFFLYSNNSLAQNERTMNSVVKIISYENSYLYSVDYCKKNYEKSYALPKTSTSLGSGVLISEDGLILTAKHVVEGSRIFLVRLPGDNEEIYHAFFVYADEELDIAFLYLNIKVKNYINVPQEMPKFNYNSHVVAIGYPLDPTAIRPTISKGEVTSWSQTEIQFDAKIIGGFSGGALVSEKNELMGIISYHFIGNAQAPNLSRAVILDKIKRMIKEEVPHKLHKLITSFNGFTNKQINVLNKCAKIFYYNLLNERNKLVYPLNQLTLEEINEILEIPSIISSYLSLEIFNYWLDYIDYLYENNVIYVFHSIIAISQLVSLRLDCEKSRFGALSLYPHQRSFHYSICLIKRMFDKAKYAYKLDYTIINPESTKIDGVEVYNLVNYIYKNSSFYLFSIEECSCFGP